jgi:hypothetical protein
MNESSIVVADLGLSFACVPLVDWMGTITRIAHTRSPHIIGPPRILRALV